MNMLRWQESIRQNPVRVAIPIMTHPGIDFIGKNVRDVVTDGQAHYAAIMALAQHYPAAASTIIMDLTVEAEAFGCPVSFGDHEIPAISAPAVADAASVESLAIPSLDQGRIPQYLLATRLAAANVKGKPVLAGCIGPFSLAGRLHDMTELMVATYTEPEMVEALLEKCTRFLITYAQALKATGAHGLVMAEPAAGLLSAEMCDRFSSVYVKRVVEAVQDDNFLFILHNCGNTGHATQSMVSTGARAFHFGNKIDLVRVLQEVPADRLVLGNLDPVSVFKSATPEGVYAAAAALLEQTKSFPNFILSSGCDTPPGVTAANIAAFFKALADFNARH